MTRNPLRDRAGPFGASMMAMQTIRTLVARRESMLIRE